MVIPRRSVVWSVAALLCVALPATSSLAREKPARNPAAASRFRGGAGIIDPLAFVQRLRTAVDSLELTDDEKTRVGAVLDKADDDAKAMEPDLRDLTPRERLEKVGPFASTVLKQLAKELTPDQRNELRQKMTRGPHAVIERIKSLIPQLDPDDEQKKQLADLFQQAEKKADELREKKEKGEDVTQEVKQTMDDFRESLKTILNPDQLAKLHELMGRPGKGAPSSRRSQ